MTTLSETRFIDACQESIDIADPVLLSEAEHDQLVQAYDRHGIVVFRTALMSASDVINALRTSLDLGDPFRPPMYSGTSAVRPDGLSDLNVAARKADAPVHPSFGTTAGQRLHTDATLQALGLVTTTILYCEEAASSGGITYFLNTAAMFDRLRESDPAAAAELERPEVLRRISNFGDERRIADGAAFELHPDGRSRTRFALSTTDYWNIRDGEEGRALLRGLSFILDAQRPGSPDFAELTLEPGQGVIFANDRLSHGRTAFENAPGRPRSVQRGLFTQTPRPRGKK